MLVFPALLLPLTAQLGLKMSEVLQISFWMYLLFGISALPWGIAADRWGARPLLLVYHTGAGISGLVAAFLLNSPAGLGIALAGIGFFSGIYHPAGLGWISKEIKRVSIGMAYNGMFGNLGLAMAPLIAGTVNFFSGPQMVYIILGLLNLSGIIFIFLAPGTSLDKRTKKYTPGKEESLKSFIILLAAMMLGGIVYRSTTIIIPAYFQLRNNMLLEWSTNFINMPSANVIATATTSLIYFVGMLGQYFGGRVAERFELKYAYLAFHAITVPIAFFMADTANLLLILLAMIHAFFLLGMQPIENTLVARFTPRKLHHAAFGMKFIFTFGIGALAVKIIKIIQTNWGISAVFPCLALVSLSITGVIVILILNTRQSVYILKGKK